MKTNSVEQQLVDLATEPGTDPFVKHTLLHMAAQKILEDIKEESK